MNYNNAIKISDKIWWVGHYLPNDEFQCHVYLIENGKNSILIDPGSVLTFENTKRKIESILPINYIKYIICHHQDPDITGALYLIENLITRDDLQILTHKRTIALLKHLGLKTPLYCVEEINWHINCEGKILEFIFTPYLHFAGAFCTYDPENKILFSSDIFGGFTLDWDLYAKDSSYFESMRPFHEHYMPSRNIMVHAMNKLSTYNIKLIAPQHGSLIPDYLINEAIDFLKTLDCGLYIMTHSSTNISRLSMLNQLLRNFMEVMVTYTDFKEIITSCLQQLNMVLETSILKFYTIDTQNNLTCFYSTSNGHKDNIKSILEGLLINFFSEDKFPWERQGDSYIYCGKNNKNADFIVFPLIPTDNVSLLAFSVFYIPSLGKLDFETRQTIIDISHPLSIAVERESLFRSVENEREKFYIQSTKDPLTDLYTRFYMNQTVNKLISIHNRNPQSSFFLISLDIDYFKSVNDTYGHIAGDKVLKKVSSVILKESRSGDIPVRLGGEEFVIFGDCLDLNFASQAAERIRVGIENLNFEGELNKLKVTISIGVILHKHNETLEEALHRADTQLYLAKRDGRNRVSVGN